MFQEWTCFNDFTSSTPALQHSSTPALASPQQTTSTKNHAVSEEAKRALKEIIRQFTLYELKAQWHLKPSELETFKQNHATDIAIYSTFKYEELKKYLPKIELLLQKVKQDYPELLVEPVKHCKNWKPSMNMTEAKQFNIHSHYKRIVYHLTSKEAKPNLLQQGFNEDYANSGAVAFFTPSRSIVNNILQKRPANNNPSESEVVVGFINTPHPLISYDSIKALFSQDLDSMVDNFPLFWGIKNEYRMKAKKIIYTTILKEIGVKALTSAYRGRDDGEIMVIDPQSIVLIKEPHNLDYRLNYPENPNQINQALTLKDYITTP